MNLGTLYLPTLSGTVDPNGVIIGSIGQAYLQNDGGVGKVHIKQTGNGTNTGWVELTPSSSSLKYGEFTTDGGVDYTLDVPAGSSVKLVMYNNANLNPADWTFTPSTKVLHFTFTPETDMTINYFYI